MMHAVHFTLTTKTPRPACGERSKPTGVPSTTRDPARVTCQRCGWYALQHILTERRVDAALARPLSTLEVMHCDAWLKSSTSGNDSTGKITMRLACGYPFKDGVCINAHNHAPVAPVTYVECTTCNGSRHIANADGAVDACPACNHG